MKAMLKDRPALRWLLIVGVLVLAYVVYTAAYGVGSYGKLLDADTLNIYSGGVLIKTVDDPHDLVATYKGTVGVAHLRRSDLGVKIFGTKELYRLEFLKDGKRLSVIKVMTPKDPDSVEQSSLNGAWKKMGDKYVVMRRGGKWFNFGPNFFGDLESILNE